MNVHLASPVHAVVALCTCAGFLIVWLVMPSRAGQTPTGDAEMPSAARPVPESPEPPEETSFSDQIS